MRDVDRKGLALLSRTVDTLNQKAGRDKLLLWHYTSGMALKEILKIQEIWSTHYTCLNDEREVSGGFNVLLRWLGVAGSPENYKHDDRLNKFFDRMRFLLRGELLPELKQPPFGFPESYVNGNFECFVASFSEENDDVAQWRAYGGGEGGYALGFEQPIFDPRCQAADFGSIRLAPVLYDPDDQSKLVRDFIDEIVSSLKEELAKPPELRQTPYHNEESIVLSTARDALTIFSYIAPLFKDRSFRAEQEWRILFHAEHLKLNECASELMQFSPKATVLSRHVRLKFRKELLRQIKVGPSRYKNASVSSINLLLSSFHSYPSIHVSASNAPYRPS